MLTSSTTHQHLGYDDPTYTEYTRRLQDNFTLRTHQGVQLFTVKTAGLWDAYLSGFPEETRQVHNCRTCQHFIERQGSLVVINQDGSHQSPYWEGAAAPHDYVAAVQLLARAIRRAEITGVYRTRETKWGIDRTGEWAHYSIRPAHHLVSYPSARPLQTPFQAMAEKREDYQDLRRALGEYQLPTIQAAHQLLAAGKLARSEKALSWAKWLQDLAEAVHPQETRQRNNGQIWRAVASAPKGWCQVRSGMLGTLLDDLKAGLPFEALKARWDDKMDPMQYMRPTAAPTDGAIKRAEEIFQALGLAPALERRFARLHEVWDYRLWGEAPEQIPVDANPGGLFGHLRTARKVQQAPYVVQPVEKVTWSRFRRSILPMVQKLDVRVGGAQAFVGLLTATRQDAPPILQWDSQEARNPFSWYVYQGGSYAVQWGLASASWVACPAVVPKPSMWAGKSAHQGEGMIFVLDGCRETREPGLALFPEILRSDLHEVRKVIEAHSNSTKPTGAEEGSANGLLLDDNNPIHVRVHLASGVAEYKIERWD